MEGACLGNKSAQCIMFVFCGKSPKKEFRDCISAWSTVALPSIRVVKLGKGADHCQKNSISYNSTTWQISRKMSFTTLFQCRLPLPFYWNEFWDLAKVESLLKPLLRILQCDYVVNLQTINVQIGRLVSNAMALSSTGIVRLVLSPQSRIHNQNALQLLGSDYMADLQKS